MNSRTNRRAGVEGAIASNRSRKTERRPEQDEAQRENRRLQQENRKLREQLAERDKKIADAEKQIADAEKQIADLERELVGYKKNSRNSSKPPSTDGLTGEQGRRRRGKRSGRRPGGQPGHDGAYRLMVEGRQIDEIVPILPAECKHCGHQLPQQGKRLQTVGKVHCHQVTELPEIKPWITEYQCPKVLCPDCGKGTRAPLPEEFQDQFGPQLTALIAYMTVVCRMPRRVVEAFLENVLHIPVSLGSTQKAWEETSEALQQPCQELQEQLKSEPVLNTDETGWRNGGEKRWMWALVAQGFVFYTVAANRSSAVLIHLLGAVFQGVLCSDRAKAYQKYHRGSAQWCWAHLKRNILGILDFAKSTEAERFCRDALALHARLFRLWHRHRGDEGSRQQLVRKSIPLQKKFFALAESHLDSKDREVCNMAHALFMNSGRLFTFLEVPGVEPTNNVAEWALRIAVQWRKVVFGNRSRQGEIATARLLTATQTCKIQRRNALDYLTDAVRCHRKGTSAPSLLPQQK